MGREDSEWEDSIPSQASCPETCAIGRSKGGFSKLDAQAACPRPLRYGTPQGRESSDSLLFTRDQGTTSAQEKFKPFPWVPGGAVGEMVVPVEGGK